MTRVENWDALRFTDDISWDDMEKVMYAAEAWMNDGSDAIISFDEIRDWFDGWDQSENDDRYDDVHDYIWDCLGYGFHALV